ncbi:MAG: hypothetical protein Q8S71_16010 [Hydrogenophaga sp.]|jgi:hypothetical protein|nr:hypothetical protein [Hydrogenophaga sp.]
MNPVLMAAALALSAAAHSQTSTPATSQVVLVCEAAYLPARTVWTRTVAIEYDQQRVRSVLIDGVPVYTFAIRGTVILTSLDNERIQINTAAQSWSSDFRGVASAHGRCERGRPMPAVGAAAPG